MTTVLRRALPTTRSCCRDRGFATGKGINANQVYQTFVLQDSWEVAKDSKVLRFSLPAVGEGDTNITSTLDLPAPSGVKVKADTDTEGLVSKSYSPISHPDAVGYCDLLVKSYAAPEGAMSRYLCELQPGEQAEVRGRCFFCFRTQAFAPKWYRHSTTISRISVMDKASQNAEL